MVTATCTSQVRVVATAAALLAVTFVGLACQPKPACCRNPVPVAIPAVNFDDFQPVNTADYHTYEDYGWNGVQFATTSGVRCRIYDGPHSFQYAAGIDCWGPLAGVAPSVNFAKVSMWPYDRNSLTPYTSGPVPDSRVFSLFNHADVRGEETYMDGPTQRKTVEPSSYHLLAPGQKIVIPGGRPGGPAMNDAVCAVGADDLVACEIRNAEFDHGVTHGFRFSQHGSQVY